MANSTEFITYNIEVNTKTGQVNIEGITKGFEDADRSFSKLKANVSKGLGNLNKNLDDSRKATGAATSATLELGRVISDAPYGIRGMANNVSQLASQLSFMSNKVDETTGKVVGFNGAMKNLAQAIKANAVLLIIQAVISAVDYFSNRVNEADKALVALADSGVSESVTELTLLKRALEDSSVPLEEKQKLLKNAREEYEELNDAIKDTPDNIINAINALDLLILKYQDFARAKALTELVTEAMKEQARTLSNYKGDWTDMFVSFDSFMTSTAAALSGRGLGIGEAMANDLQKSSDAIKLYEEMLKQPSKSDPTKTYLELIYGKKGKDKDVKPTVLITPEEFKTQSLSLQSEIDAWNKKMLMAATKDKDQLLQLELIFYKKKQNILRQEREDAAYNELFKYEDKIDKLVAAGKMEESEGEKAKSTALIKTQEKVDNINSEHDRLITKATEATKSLRLGLDNEDSQQEQIDMFKFRIEKYMEAFNSLTNFMDGEYDRQLTIEQNKTNALNNELNQRLLNENLSKEERKRIQLQIGANDEALRKKQEKIEKKRFKMNKAANLAQATISTYLGATKAYTSQLIPGDPTSIIRAKIAGAAALASGLLQVAAIARTKFQSSAGSGGQIGGGFGGDGERASRSFNFNLAGSTGENQLAQTLQGRFDQPLQAYVVSRDITNAQQLQEDIQNNASFG